MDQAPVVVVPCPLQAHSSLVSLEVEPGIGAIPTCFHALHEHQKHFRLGVLDRGDVKVELKDPALEDCLQIPFAALPATVEPSPAIPVPTRS